MQRKKQMPWKEGRWRPRRKNFEIEVSWARLERLSPRSTGNYETCVKSRRYRKSSCRQAWPSSTLVVSSYSFAILFVSLYLRSICFPSLCPPSLSFIVTDIANNRGTYSTANSKELTRYTITSKKRYLPVPSYILVCAMRNMSSTYELLSAKRMWYYFHGEFIGQRDDLEHGIESSTVI